MQLCEKDIRAMLHGALEMTEVNGEWQFHRFTAAQRALYDEVNKDFARKTYATSGIRLEFVTDADEFSFCYRALQASSRKFYYFDVFVDGVMVQHTGHEGLLEACNTLEIKLPAGTHKVAVYFPNLFQGRIWNVQMNDGATFSPVQKARKLLCYGDSITQGYDAKFASQSYANLLADKLGAEMVDQAIGGEIFRPELLTPLGYDPEIITVAYGTNDWSGQTRERTEKCANEFYARLAALYPNAKIFAITPIWRADDDRITKVGVFEESRVIVRNAARAAGATVIEGDGMIPHMPEVCSDAYLHPNDFGFKFYANALYDAITAHLCKEDC